jgi:predicted metal-dependent HD superfamily phosphohydrolase
VDKVILKIRPYTQELFKRRTFPYLKYHNLTHTEKVVERSIEISKSYPIPLNEREFLCLMTAAWFHDTGHLFNELKQHEQAGVDLMASFLKSFLIEDSIIDEIGRCIMATKLPSNPQTELERILCDADTYHFGTKEFLETDPKIYAELEERLNIHIDNKAQKTISLLESHNYYTTYCQDLLGNGKKENIAHFRRLLNG